MLCHCGGDIDDCQFEGTEEQLRCGHCDDADDDPSEEYRNEEFKQPIPQSNPNSEIEKPGHSTGQL